MTSTPSITVLGVGNPIMRDDGVGLALLERLMAPGDLDVEFVDGGTAGMSLLPLVSDAHSLLVLDAVAGSTAPDPVAPGTVVHLDGDQLPRLLTGKLSPHQVDLLDVLAGCRLLGSEPRRLTVVGVVPEVVDFGLGLSPVVAGALPAAEALARRVLADWRAEDPRPVETGHR
ncbi:HyaD/HybD family hydrogenase maturation endopeptidase [Nocardioides hungaricus]